MYSLMGGDVRGTSF